jgi:hypothetical protein
MRRRRLQRKASLKSANSLRRNVWEQNISNECLTFNCTNSYLRKQNQKLLKCVILWKKTFLLRKFSQLLSHLYVHWSSFLFSCPRNRCEINSWEIPSSLNTVCSSVQMEIWTWWQTLWLLFMVQKSWMSVLNSVIKNIPFVYLMWKINALYLFTPLCYFLYGGSWWCLFICSSELS